MPKPCAQPIGWLRRILKSCRPRPPPAWRHRRSGNSAKATACRAGCGHHQPQHQPEGEHPSHTIAPGSGDAQVARWRCRPTSRRRMAQAKHHQRAHAAALARAGQHQVAPGPQGADGARRPGREAGAGAQRRSSQPGMPAHEWPPAPRRRAAGVLVPARPPTDADGDLGVEASGRRSARPRAAPRPAVDAACPGRPRCGRCASPLPAWAGPHGGHDGGGEDEFSRRRPLSVSQALQGRRQVPR